MIYLKLYYYTQEQNAFTGEIANPLFGLLGNDLGIMRFVFLRRKKKPALFLNQSHN